MKTRVSLKYFVNDCRLLWSSFPNVPALSNHIILAGPNYFVSGRSDDVLKSFFPSRKNNYS